MNKPEIGILDERDYEYVLSRLWNKIERSGGGKSFNFSIGIGSYICDKIEHRLWSFKHHLNTNYLNEHGLHIVELKIKQEYHLHSSEYYTSGIIELTMEEREIKNTDEKIEEMVMQMYYSPGMPGYVLAKEDFEKNI